MSDVPKLNERLLPPYTMLIVIFPFWGWGSGGGGGEGVTLN